MITVGNDTLTAKTVNKLFKNGFLPEASRTRLGLNTSSDIAQITNTLNDFLRKYISQDQLTEALALQTKIQKEHKGKKKTDDIKALGGIIAQVFDNYEKLNSSGH